VLENPTFITVPFPFPPHGHKFRYITIHPNQRREEKLRLCRYPACLNCQKPLAKSKITTLSFIELRNFSPIRTSWHKPMRTTWHFPTLATPTQPGTVDMEILDIINRMSVLPLELRQIIIDYCNESLLWKYCAVTVWYSLYNKE
jgi:hypothetical protein